MGLDCTLAVCDKHNCIKTYDVGGVYEVLEWAKTYLNLTTEEINEGWFRRVITKTKLIDLRFYLFHILKSPISFSENYTEVDAISDFEKIGHLLYFINKILSSDLYCDDMILWLW